MVSAFLQYHQQAFWLTRACSEPELAFLNSWQIQLADSGLQHRGWILLHPDTEEAAASSETLVKKIDFDTKVLSSTSLLCTW